MKKKVFTIPNILSMIRILMIPAIVMVYFSEIENHYLIAIILVLLSGLTDVVDGFIARRFNLISDLGKILDPIADKLTQFTVTLCLAIRHPSMIPIAVIIFIKELLMLIGTVLFLHKGNATPQARWWGKMTTVILYLTITLFIVSDILIIPDSITLTAVSMSIAGLMFSFYNYLVVYFEGAKKALSDKTNPKDEGEPA